LQQIFLFDHFVGAAEQGTQQVHGEQFRGLEIDDQLPLCGLLHRQVGGLFALENAPEWSPGLKVASSDRTVSDEKLDHNVLELRVIHSMAGFPPSQPG
jgi:hypothetical protein